jgi:hypothetical protein
MVLLSTLTIDHFDLFGLRQVYLYLRGQEYPPVRFKMPALYYCLPGNAGDDCGSLDPSDCDNRLHAGRDPV